MYKTFMPVRQQNNLLNAKGKFLAHRTDNIAFAFTTLLNSTDTEHVQKTENAYHHIVKIRVQRNAKLRQCG